MEAASDRLIVYRELADHYDRLGQVSMRDRFLMLAADSALEDGQPGEADRLRQRLLATSRHHMLRPYASFAEAARAPDVDTYLRDLRANYPLDEARDLLDTLRAGQSAASPPAPRAQHIPPTAPLLDLDAPAAPRREAGPIPLRADDPDPAVPARPWAQPLPGRRAAPRPPVAMPVARPIDSTPAPAPVAMAQPTHRKPGPRGVWLSNALIAIAVTTGVALAAFTLARPFLAANWFP